MEIVDLRKPLAHWPCAICVTALYLALGAPVTLADETHEAIFEGESLFEGVEIADADTDPSAPEAGAPRLVDELIVDTAPPADEAVEAEPECTDADLEKLRQRVATAYKGVFYDNDFSYLCDPCYCDWHLGEHLKRLCLGDCGVLDIGGEYRTRFHDEHNMRGLLFLGRDDEFLLHRWRLYGNAELGEHTRVYVEYLDAVSNYEDFAPRIIEENRSDLLNAFVDLKLLDDCRGRWTARVGRQELLYGDQRLISPLDWANTRRTFDGAKLMWKRGDWSVDGFWTRPVLVDVHNFDEADENQEFYGLWATHKAGDCRTRDYYWIGYHDYDSPYAQGRSFKFQTCGARQLAKHGDWQTLGQFGLQFGDFGEFDHIAGFYVLGLGRTCPNHAWKPTLWAYFDWASGDDVQGNGFNQLFPLGHKYLGYMDLFARSNIQDLNLQLTLQPCSQLTLVAWWHCFWLQNDDDVPYTVTGLPYVATPGGDPYLGQELDFTLAWKCRPRTELLVGYSHFFTGDWFRTNPEASTGSTADADFFYLQLTQQF